MTAYSQQLLNNQAVCKFSIVPLKNNTLLCLSTPFDQASLFGCGHVTCCFFSAKHNFSCWIMLDPMARDTLTTLVSETHHFTYWDIYIKKFPNPFVLCKTRLLVANKCRRQRGPGGATVPPTLPFYDVHRYIFTWGPFFVKIQTLTSLILM